MAHIENEQNLNKILAARVFVVHAGNRSAG